MLATMAWSPTHDRMQCLSKSCHTPLPMSSCLLVVRTQSLTKIKNLQFCLEGAIHALDPKAVLLWGSTFEFDLEKAMRTQYILRGDDAVALRRRTARIVRLP